MPAAVSRVLLRLLRLVAPRRGPPEPLRRLAAEDPARVRLVVGLGNPGRAYASHRHNAGFQCVDVLGRQLGAEWHELRGPAASAVALVHVGDRAMLLAKPLTYMNASGRAVRDLLAATGLEPAALLVVYDDMDLPLGSLRLRERGSAGSHNGMRSLVAELGTEQFARLRIGIGQATLAPARDHVLASFTPAERERAEAAIARAAEAVSTWATAGAAAAMNQFNS